MPFPARSRAALPSLLLAAAVVSTAAGAPPRPAPRRPAGPAPKAGAKRAAKPPAKPPRPAGTYVTLETTLGPIVMRMLPQDAPETVANFVGLAEGKKPFRDLKASPGSPMVRRPFYDGLTFHRVVKGFMIQGGCPKGDGAGGPGYTIPDELPPRRPYVRGAVLMSRRGRPNSAGSQFFILQADVRRWLPQQYVVFGEVVEGLDVVDRIARVPTKPNPYRPSERSVPATPVVIRKAIVTRVR